MNNPITVPLPQDLPTNWTYGQTVAPNGAEVGLAQQYGYNYLMAQVNAAQKAAQEVGNAIPYLVASSTIGHPNGVAELDGSGKVPTNQLPAMNYDPAGSAQAVQTNLTNHINNKNNPHDVTASQVTTSTGINVENALSTKLQIYQNNAEGLDCNSFINDGRYQCQGALLNSPPWVDGAKYGHFFIDVFRHSDLWITQVAHAVNGRKSYIRHRLNGIWDPWNQILTESQITEYQLPLSAGLADYASGVSRYWINQFGEVGFILAATTTSEIESMSLLATFPAGFRPSAVTLFNLGSYSPSSKTRSANSANLSINGQLEFYGPIIPTGSTIWCTGVFLASN